MARITIDGTQLVVTVTGADRILAVKSSIRVPLQHVRGATADRGIVKDPKGRRGPGAHIPGVVVAGTFHQDGERVFWDVHNGDQVVVIELEEERYTRLVVEVDDADAIVRLVERARLAAGPNRRSRSRPSP